MKWELLNSKYLFTDDWLTLRSDSCTRPDGTIIEPYYVYEFPDWVTAVALTKERQIILIQQYRHALGSVCIEIPGGCIDPSDTTPEEACARELLEETGYRFNHFELLCTTSANPSTNNNLMHIFLATGGEKIQEQQLDLAEDITVSLYTIEEVKQLLRDQKIVQSMHVTALFYGLEKLGVLVY